MIPFAHYLYDDLDMHICVHFLSLCKAIVDMNTCSTLVIIKWYWHSFAQSSMGSHERSTHVGIFPEPIHHIRNASSLCFYISSEGNDRNSVISCVFCFASLRKAL